MNNSTSHEGENDITLSNPISLHSLLRMNGSIHNTLIFVLHDDGSTHDFISSCLVQKLNIKIIKSNFKVKSAFEGTRYNGISLIHNLEITIGAYTQKCSFLVAPLRSTYVILGIPFHHKNNPNIDYAFYTMQFTFNNQAYVLSFFYMQAFSLTKTSDKFQRKKSFFAFSKKPKLSRIRF